MPARPTLALVTHPNAALDGLTRLYVEVGTPPGSLHLEYAKKRDAWVRSEQAFANGWATSEEFFAVVEEPLHDVLAQVASWGVESLPLM